MNTRSLKVLLSIFCISIGAILLAPSAKAIQLTPDQHSVLDQTIKSYNEDYTLDDVYFVMALVNRTNSHNENYQEIHAYIVNKEYNPNVELKSTAFNHVSIYSTTSNHSKLRGGHGYARSFSDGLSSLTYEPLFNFSVIGAGGTITETTEYTFITNIPSDWVTNEYSAQISFYEENALPVSESSTDNSTIYSEINGYFSIEYYDFENDKSFDVRLEPRYFPERPNDPTLHLTILDPDETGFSYTGHFRFNCRGNPRSKDYAFSSFKWVIGSLKNEALPSINNTHFKVEYSMLLFGSNDTIIPYTFTDDTSWNISGYPYEATGFKDVLLASNFNEHFENGETCVGFSFVSVLFYPENVRRDSYIFSGETHGQGSYTALDNQVKKDLGSITPPVTFDGNNPATDFNYDTPDDYDFSSITDLLSMLFNPFVTTICSACVIIGLVGYVLYGKN